MNTVGLRNPLGATRVVSSLERELHEQGLSVSTHDDLRQLAALKQSVRQETVAPYFDQSVNNTQGNRFFWMQLLDEQGQTVGLQAFRLDNVNSSLADWGPTYTIGLYMRRQEVLVPLLASPPSGSISEQIRGNLVYHGELWIDRKVKARRVVEVFGRLGMLLALLRWNPDAIWALASQTMATRGHLNRMGFSYIERGFFSWQWGPEGADDVEWIAIAERRGLEQLIEEMLITPQQYQLA